MPLQNMETESQLAANGSGNFAMKPFLLGPHADETDDMFSIAAEFQKAGRHDETEQTHYIG